MVYESRSHMKPLDNLIGLRKQSLGFRPPSCIPDESYEVIRITVLTFELDHYHGSLSGGEKKMRLLIKLRKSCWFQPDWSLCSC